MCCFLFVKLLRGFHSVFWVMSISWLHTLFHSTHGYTVIILISRVLSDPSPAAFHYSPAVASTGCPHGDQSTLIERSLIQSETFSLLLFPVQVMAQQARAGKRYLRAFVSGFFVAVPVTVTVLDRLACVARVEGASMQVSGRMY